MPIAQMSFEMTWLLWSLSGQSCFAAQIFSSKKDKKKTTQCTKNEKKQNTMIWLLWSLSGQFCFVDSSKQDKTKTRHYTKYGIHRNRETRNNETKKKEEEKEEEKETKKLKKQRNNNQEKRHKIQWFDCLIFVRPILPCQKQDKRQKTKYKRQETKEKIQKQYKRQNTKYKETK